MTGPPRVKTPTVLQMEAVECGAAALGSVLGYHGRHIPLSQLREECGVNRDGSRAINVIQAAKMHGLTASGYRRDVDTLLESTTLPAILFWRASHFLVFEGTDAKHVYLNDPACGHRRITREELARDYSGVVLEFSPGPDFEKQQKPRHLLQGIRERVEDERPTLMLILGLTMLLVLPSLAIPVYSKVFVDKVLVAGNMAWVVPLLVAMLLTLLMQGSLTWIQRYYILLMQTKLTLTSSSRFMWHVLNLPSRFFAQRFAPEITQRCRLNEMVATLLSTQFTSGALSLFLAIFYTLAMFFYDWILTLVCVAVIVANGLFLKYAAPRRHDEFMRSAQERGKVDATAMAALQSIDTIKAQGMEADVFAYWAGHHAGAVQSAQSLGSLSNIMGLVPVALTGLSNVVILGLGAGRVMSGMMTLGELVAFQAFAAMLFAPVSELIALAGMLQDAGASMRRLDDVLTHPTERDTATLLPDHDTVMTGVQGINGTLELKDITFGYSVLDKPLIENFSLSVPPGARVALVGGSGSGKSTLARIVAGLYQPWSGQVLLDGMPREEIPHFVLRDSVQMVDQNIFLFSGSVRENLTLWDPTVTDESMVRALKDAEIYDVVAGLPGGLDGILLENGSNLSGGQRQALEIARALICDPALLILDEATNSLDTIKELAVDFNIRRRGCTCLMVAHRLSTIRDADEIIVLDHGKVVERGDHEALMALGGRYSKLIAKENG